MKTTIKACVHWQQYSWEESGKYVVYACDMTSSGPERVFISEQEIEVEVPDNFDPRPKQVEILRSAKSALLAKAHVQAENIEEQIQRLLCIEHKLEAA